MKSIVSFITIAASLNMFAPTARAEAPKLPVEVKVKEVAFHVSLVRTAEGDSLKIAITGQAAKSEPALVPIKGKLVFLEAADLKDDGLPEIYLAIAPVDPRERSQLIAFVADKDKGLVRASFTHQASPPKLEFRGGDRFSIKDGHLVHRVTLYRRNDEEGSPSAWQEDTFGLSSNGSGAWSFIAVGSRAGMGRVNKKPR